MKKLLVVLMVLAFVAPAMADDALDASGSMRVEVYSQQNATFQGGDENDQDFWDQRFRLQIRMKPADGVSATLRTDITEDTWGNTDGAGFNRPSAGTNGQLMIDRAYLSVDKGLINITGGLTAFNLGMGHSYNNQGQGLQLTLKTPVSVKVGLTKESESGGLDDVFEENDPADPDDDITTEDTDTYFIELGFKNDMLAASLFYATETSGNDSDDSPTVIGAMVNTKIGPAAVKAQLDVFGGEQSDDVDYAGTQFYAQVDFKLSDQIKVGTDLVYSTSVDPDDDEAKLTAVNKFGDYVYQDRHALSPGSFQSQVLGADGDIFDLLPDGLVSDVEAAGGLPSGSLSGASTGSIGIGPYIYFTAMEGLTLKGSVFYLTADDDLDAIESALIYTLAAKWAMAPKTTLEVAYHAVNLSAADDLEDGLDALGVDFEDSFTGFGAVLTVGF